MDTTEEFDLFFIDMNRLDEQVAEQAFLFIQYSKELKAARRELNQRKSELDLAKADVGLWVAKKPKKYGLSEKPTKQMIELIIIKHPKQKKALATFYEAQELVDSLQIYVNAFDHRKKMLEEAVKLHGQAYFATPYIASSEIKEVVEQLNKKKARTRKQGKRRSRNMK